MEQLELQVQAARKRVSPEFYTMPDATILQLWEMVHDRDRYIQYLETRE